MLLHRVKIGAGWLHSPRVLITRWRALKAGWRGFYRLALAALRACTGAGAGAGGRTRAGARACGHIYYTTQATN